MQLSPLPPGDPYLGSDRHPGDPGPSPGREIRLGQRREIGPRRPRSEHHEAVPWGGLVLHKALGQGEDIVMREVLASEPFRQAHALLEESAGETDLRQIVYHRAQLAPPPALVEAVDCPHVTS